MFNGNGNSTRNCTVVPGAAVSRRLVRLPWVRPLRSQPDRFLNTGDPARLRGRSRSRGRYSVQSMCHVRRRALRDLLRIYPAGKGVAPDTCGWLDQVLGSGPKGRPGDRSVTPTSGLDTVHGDVRESTD